MYLGTDRTRGLLMIGLQFEEYVGQELNKEGTAAKAGGRCARSGAGEAITINIDLG